MRPLLLSVSITLLFVLCITAVVRAQTATPLPSIPDPVYDYEQAALVQLGNIRNAAGDMYQLNAVNDAILTFYAELLQDEVSSFVATVTPPEEFAPFHTRLFMALRPCITTNRALQSMETDVFSLLLASSYAQACYAAVSDASVEWSRVTGTSPTFAPLVPSDMALTPTPLPMATTELTPTATVTTLPAADVSNIDDLGLSWSLAANADPSITLEEWTAYVNRDGDFAVAGRLRNSDTSRQFSLASIVLKFYDADGKLIGVEEGSASGHWVAPGELTTFSFDTYFAPDGVASYVIEIFGIDWQE